MKNGIRLSRKMVAGAVAASLLMGGTAVAGVSSANAAGVSASAQTQKQTPPNGGERGGFFLQGIDYTALAARILGVEQSALLAALEDGTTLAEYGESLGITEAYFLEQWAEAIEEAVAAAVAAGTLTQEQADQALAGLAEQLQKLAESEGFALQGEPGQGQGGGQAYSALELAAALFGVDTSELLTALGDDQTLLDYAVSRGLTEEGFAAQLTAAAQAAIAEQVTAGTLTQEQADKALEKLSDTLTRQIGQAMPAMNAQPGQGQQVGGSKNDANNAGTGSPSNSDSSVELTDIKNHWAATAIQDLAARGIVQGDQNKKFNPGGAVTREALATMLAKAFNLNASSESQSSTYSDVPSSRWSYSSVEATKTLFQTDDGKFGPTENSTRVEVVVSLIKALLEGDSSIALLDSAAAETVLTQKFKDASSIPSASRAYVATAVQLGIVNGDTEGNFSSSKSVSRAEIASMLYAALSKLNG